MTGSIHQIQMLKNYWILFYSTDGDRSYTINILVSSKSRKHYENQPQEHHWEYFNLWMENNDKWQNNVKWTLTLSESERLPVHTNVLPQGCMQTCCWSQTRNKSVLLTGTLDKNVKQTAYTVWVTWCKNKIRLLCLDNLLWLTTGETLMKRDTRAAERCLRAHVSCQ